MKKFFALAIIVLLAGCDFCNICNRTQESSNAESAVAKVELTGHKTQKFVANRFLSTLLLEIRDADKESAYKKLGERRSRIFEVAKSLDIPESSVEQNSVSLTKEWHYEKGVRKLVGYVATQRFNVALDSRADAVIFAQTLSEEPDVEILSTDATLKDADSLQGVIIEAAVKDGMNKATHYAAGAGLSLGRVLYIVSEGEGVYASGSRRKARMMMMSNGADNVNADDSAIADSVEISANVRLQVELK